MNNKLWIPITIFIALCCVACHNSSDEQKIEKLEQEVSKLDSEKQVSTTTEVDSDVSSSYKPTDGPTDVSVGINKFKCSEFRMYVSSDSVTDHPWQGTNLFVTINLDDKKIRIYSSSKGEIENIDLVRMTNDFTDRNGNGWSIYDAINGNDQNCSVLLNTIDEPTDGIILVLTVVDATYTTNFRLKSGW